VWHRVPTPNANIEWNYGVVWNAGGTVPGTDDGNFATFAPRYLGTVGSTPSSPATWPASEYQGVSGVGDASNTLYGLKGRGYRHSLVNSATDPTQSMQYRVRLWEGPGNTAIEPSLPTSPDTGSAFLFVLGRLYTIKERLVGNTLTTVKTDTTDDSTQTWVFTSTGFGSSGNGVGGYSGFAVSHDRDVSFLPVEGIPFIQAI
jgi:hypothetical protein